MLAAIRTYSTKRIPFPNLYPETPNHLPSSERKLSPETITQLFDDISKQKEQLEALSKKTDGLKFQVDTISEKLKKNT